MTRAKDIANIISDANFGGTLDVGGAFTSLGIDDNANATAITIDSSENVLVGKTTLSLANEGVELRSDRIYTTRTDDIPLYANRLGSDGDIVEFRKDTAIVGSIGSASSKLHISSNGNSGLRFRDDLSCITPCNADGSNSDDDQNLGQSGVRFKTLFLSGGVRLGGTGTANELDDYEEGTWTATLIGSGGNPSTSVTATCNYTKIGQIVYVNGQLSNFNSSGASGAVRITGIPFTSSPGNQATGNVMIQSAASWAGTNTANIAPYFTPSYIGFYASQSAGGWFEISHNATTGCYISFSGIYKV